MFGYAGARGRRDECGGGGDVEGARAVPARPCRVDQVDPLRLDSHDVRPHGLGTTGDLGGRLALQAKGDEETADLSRRGLPFHDVAHHVPGGAPREITTVEQASEGFLNRHLRPSRKFLARAAPSGVSTDSGWNWMPSTGRSRWRTAITSPSSVVAHTSSSFGTRAAASE
jgi:hypothetical protein